MTRVTTLHDYYGHIHSAIIIYAYDQDDSEHSTVRCIGGSTEEIQMLSSISMAQMKNASRLW